MGCILKPIISLIKAVLMIVGAITLVVALVIGVCAWQLTQPSALEGQMHQVVPTAIAAASFDSKVESLEAALMSAEVGGVVTLTLTEQEVTSKIDQAIREADIPVEVGDVWVNFTDGTVQILGKVNVGLELSAGLELELVIDENGEPKVTVGELSIGKGFGIPQQAKEQIANAIPSSEALTDMLKDLPIDITDIQIQEGVLTFTGVKVEELAGGL